MGEVSKKRVVKKKVPRKKPAATGDLKHFTSSFLTECLSGWADEYGDDSICTLGEFGRMLIGIPFPALSLEYVFQNTVFPLGRISQIVGTEGTFKSALTFEIARWFRASSGVTLLYEHESKFSESMAESILNYDDGALGHLPCDSINDWQKKLQDGIQAIKRKMVGPKSDPGTGKIWPVLFVVDSVMAKSTADTQQKIETKGFADRHFAGEAMMITDFMRKIPQDLRRWPFHLLTVNHLKPSNDPRTGALVRSKAGGRGLSFQETFEIDLTRTGKKIMRADETGRTLTLQVYKNSLGTDRLSIPVEVLWWYEDVESEDGEIVARQHTLWDWHTSTVRLLMNTEKPEIKKANEIVHFVACKNNQAVYASALGLTKDDPVSFREAGEMIMQNPEMLKELRKVLGIKERRVFQPDLDYDVQIKAAKAEIAKQVRQHVTAADETLVPDDNYGEDGLGEEFA